jgi:colanic acid biosynthesis glycosyl transferase WcaI
MNLLILGMNYAPEVTGIGPYTAGIAEHFAMLGHRVRVATTFPHYPSWRIQAPYQGQWRCIEQCNGVKVRRGPVYLPSRRSALQRVIYDTSLAVSTLLNSVCAPRPDLIFCVSPPIQLGLTAFLLARRWRVPIILQVKDLPLDAALAVGMLRPGYTHRVGRALEQLVYRLATRIVVISQGFRQNLLQQGVPPDRILEIPDWADTDGIRPLPQDPALRDLAGARNDDFLVLHTGNMGEKQGLSNALLAAAAIDGSMPFCLGLVGDGMDRSQLEALVEERAIRNVRFLPLQPATIFPRLLSSADALLLNQRAEVIDSVAPSKLLSYMASGRPVVAAVHADSEAARVIRAAGGGLVVPPEDPGSLIGAIRRLATDDGLGAALGAAGRRYVEIHYARENVLARFEKLFAQCTRAEAGHDVSVPA